MSEILLGEGFGEERRTRFEEPTLKHLGSEAGHVEDRFTGPALLDVPPELTAIHARHFYVGQDKMNGSGMLLDGGYGLTAMTGLQSLVAGPGQHPTG